jgi:hypothetical protein
VFAYVFGSEVLIVEPSPPANVHGRYVVYHCFVESKLCMKKNSRQPANNKDSHTMCISLSHAPGEMLVAHDEFSAIRGRLYEYASSYHKGTVFVCSYY